MDDRTVYSTPSATYLTIAKGPGQGRFFLLLEGVNSIGRAPENNIVLDQEDLKASRHHAVIRLDNGAASVEDLGSTNGTFLNGTPVSKAPLPAGAELCIGQTVFVLSASGTTAADTREIAATAGSTRRYSRKTLALAGAALVLGCLALLLFVGGKKDDGGGKEPPLGSAPTAAQPQQEQQTSPARQQQADQAQEPLRLGQFFYSSGKLKKAVEQWREALRLDPDNEQARKLLDKAERELDQLVDRHYRQALLALRYQRLDEARAELLQVVENSLVPDDERTRDSLKKLEELGGR